MKQPPSPKSFVEVTAGYEEWLASELVLVPEDLERKHNLMGAELFSFFRATFYRWAELFPKICHSCAGATQILAIGDLHVDNFGTWRDIEGRLAWGINDFDEVSRMPYTIDLVRLAASVHIAIDTAKLKLAHRDACAAILTGYKEGLEAGGRPWVIAGHHAWLRDMVGPALRDPIAFWGRLTSLPPFDGRIPKTARRGLERMMPARHLEYRTAHRVAGLGSLGRQRFVALAEFEGGYICREAKALAPSAWDWALGNALPEIQYQQALDTAVRAIDPFVRVKDSWIVRRLAPDCTKIEISMIPRTRDEVRLLQAMGWETANFHLGSGRGQRLLSDLTSRHSRWLHSASARMVSATKSDWESWRSRARNKDKPKKV
jgi:hypothetical protein